MKTINTMIKFLISLVIGFVFFGCVLFLISGRTGALTKLYLYNSANINSLVEGVVTDSKLKYGVLGGRARGYSIVYTYMVNNIAFESTLVSFSSDINYVYYERYPIGKRIFVHYDSNFPAISVLENDRPDFMVWLQALSILFISVLGFIFGFLLGPFKISYFRYFNNP